MRKQFISVNFFYRSERLQVSYKLFYIFVTMWINFIVLIGILYPIIVAENIAVLILARGGSKGVHLKNLRVVGGISLLARSILTARHAGFEDITVSTDHPLIALETLKYKAKLFKRSQVTSTDWAPSIWGVQEFLENRTQIDIVILLQATSPILKAKHLHLSIEKLRSPISFDCIFSVTRSYKLRWKYENSDLFPLNFKFEHRPRRQDWNGEFLETGAFYISRRRLIQKGHLQNDK